MDEDRINLGPVEDTRIFNTLFRLMFVSWWTALVPWEVT